MNADADAAEFDWLGVAELMAEQKPKRRRVDKFPSVNDVAAAFKALVDAYFKKETFMEPKSEFLHPNIKVTLYSEEHVFMVHIKVDICKKKTETIHYKKKVHEVIATQWKTYISEAARGSATVYSITLRLIDAEHRWEEFQLDAEGNAYECFSGQVSGTTELFFTFGQLDLSLFLHKYEESGISVRQNQNLRSFVLRGMRPTDKVREMFHHEGLCRFLKEHTVLDTDDDGFLKGGDRDKRYVHNRHNYLHPFGIEVLRQVLGARWNNSHLPLEKRFCELTSADLGGHSFRLHDNGSCKLSMACCATIRMQITFIDVKDRIPYDETADLL